MKHLLNLLVIILLAVSSGFAQETIQVSGTVTDTDGFALPGATVVLKSPSTGSPVGTVTQPDGTFSINVPKGSTLVITFIGFESQEIVVNGQKQLQIILEEETKGIEEVVVVGYGTQKKETLVGAISQAKGDDVVKMGSPSSISQSLQGMLPGVTGIVSSGQPGAENAALSIRGVSTWQGDGSPLVLVDGVERDMNDVDPNEIESVSVLKDASATAVFGVKGGNGVILITTKRGTSGETTINFSSNIGIKSPTKTTDFADRVTTMEWYNKALANDNMWEAMFPESTIEAWRQAYASGNVGPYNEYFPVVDWWDEMIKNVGISQNYNLNIRGGNEFVKYFTSVGYLNDGDIIDLKRQDDYDPRYFYKRYNWRSNFDFQLTGTTQLGLNLSGSYSIQNAPAVGGGVGRFFNNFYEVSPSDFPIRWANGTYGTSALGLGNIAHLVYQGQDQEKEFQGFVDMSLTQDLDFVTKGLIFTGKVSYNSNSITSTNVNMFAGSGTVLSKFGDNNSAENFYRLYDYANPNPDGTYPLLEELRYPTDNEYLGSVPGVTKDTWSGYNRRFYYEARLEYNRQFGKHNVGGMFSFNRNERNVGGGIPFRREDWVGRVKYDFEGRYLLEANGAYNGSENFAPGKRFGFFPSASVGWRISEEPFLKDKIGNVLTNLKVRYSIGQSGVDETIRFAYIQQYTSGGNALLGETSRNAVGPLYEEGEPANENATWETSTKQNLGVEFEFFRHFRGSVDLFKEERTGILMNRWVPKWINANLGVANLGETKNHGFEIDLHYQNKIGKHLRYDISGNMMIVENRIVFRDDGINMLEYERQAGKPIGFQRRYIAQGYYQDLDDIFNGPVTDNEATQSLLMPGDVLYVDYNGDGTITGDTKDQAVMKQMNRPFKTYSFGFNVSYKKWELNTRFYGVWDVYADIPDNIIYDYQNAQKFLYSAKTDVIYSWTPENADIAVKPVLHSSGNVKGYSRKSSTMTYVDRSYLRLKNVELSYTFNDIELTRDYKMPKLNVYVNGNNLITWTSFNKRLDPEAGGTGSYPMVRRVNIGLRATF